MKTLTAKIQRYKRASFDSLVFRIVHNYRTGANRTTTNRLIKSIVTIPENKLNDVLYQAIAWQKIEKVLANLKQQNQISETNAETIRKRFARRLPRPAAPVPIANLKPLDAAKERVNAKYGKLLSE
jgi:hypothetical protein